MIGAILKWAFDKTIKAHQNYNQSSAQHGVNLCNTICVIASGSDQACRSASEKYSDKMRTLGKNTDIIYYYDNKEEVEDGYSKKDIKWNGIPDTESIESLLNKQYDLLIFLCPKMEKHLEYIVTLSKAKFKIGPNFKDENPLFDLIIDIEDYTDTSTLLKNIDKQLKLLST